LTSVAYVVSTILGITSSKESARARRTLPSCKDIAQGPGPELAIFGLTSSSSLLNCRTRNQAIQERMEMLWSTRRRAGVQESEGRKQLRTGPQCKTRPYISSLTECRNFWQACTRA